MAIPQYSLSEIVSLGLSLNSTFQTTHSLRNGWIPMQLCVFASMVSLRISCRIEVLNSPPEFGQLSSKNEISTSASIQDITRNRMARLSGSIRRSHDSSDPTANRSKQTGVDTSCGQSMLRTHSRNPQPPFQCIMGFQPLLFPWSGEPTEVPVINDWLQRSESV